MKLSDFVCLKAVIPNLESSDRDGIIRELVQALHVAGELSANPDSIAQAVIRRENEASTGIGKGVAVPHTKHADVTKVMAAVGRKNEGIDFASLDKKPVYSVILLLSPQENNSDHLHAMETIFRNLQKDDFRNFLKQAQTSEQLQEVIQDAE